MIKVEDVIDGERGAEAWALYHAAFRELNAMTVQRHLMYRDEFDEVMSDRRVEKFLALDDNGTMTGLATYTNILPAMPLISPEYFARRWPRLHAAGKIWYCGFVAVPDHAPGAYVELVTAMYRQAEAHGGVIGLDVCRFNIERHRLDRSIAALLTRVSDRRVRCEEADAQVFEIYETAPV